MKLLRFSAQHTVVTLPIRLQVLAGVSLLLVTPLCGLRAQESPPREVAPPEIVPEQAVANEARVSLRLQKMPLPQLLALLGRQTALQFRFAAPPDAESTLNLNNAPLHAALRDVLGAQGFALRTPEASNHPGNAAWWVWREKTSNEDVDTIRSTSTWQMWHGTASPHARWMIPPTPRMGEFAGTIGTGDAPARSGAPGVPTVGVRVRWRDSTRLAEEASWKETNTVFHNGHLPGAQLDWRALSPEAAKSSLRLRWPLALRGVSGRVQLAIETDRPATLWVNGARVLRGWTGVRRVELGSSLHVGLNLLAVEWDALPPSDASANVTDAPPIVPPLLRYEWLVE